MIAPFWGELGLVPVPLEVSHNFCSHKCSYCFSNLNNPTREVDVKKLFNQIKNFQDQENFTAQMLQNKLCVAVSNKTDPFARSNYKIAIPMFEALTSKQIPVFIQTRGGFGMEEVLPMLPKSLFYISITHSNETTRKKIEPAATSLQSRWELVDQLKSLGHKVFVAANPYHSFWINNDEFLKDLEIHKPDGLILQLLHLNAKQISNMSEKERTDFTEESLKIARKRNIDWDQYNAMMDLHHRAQAMGIKIKNYNAPELINDAVPIYHEVYGNSVFKTKFDFVEHCRRTKKDNDIVTFKEYIDFMLEGNPFRKGKYSIASYLTSQSKEFRNGVKMPSKMSYIDVMKISWNDDKARKMLNDISSFAQLILKDGEEDYLPVDDDNNSYFVWNSTPFEDYSTSFSNQYN